ncbi:MAG: response regulator transcription factor [Desulfomonilaceae bacterium]|nr:response regulator transcription factor [Desulfomonilaceae bacterium]
MRSPHILVAEDDSHILMGLVDTLESEGYRVTPASDGNQALEMLNRESFDLVILDIMMPGTSGYDVCRDIRSHDQDQLIMMLTAKGEEIDKVVGLELGADDYVTKPFGVREFLARIAALLRRSRRNRDHSVNPAPCPDLFTFGEAEIDALQYRARIMGTTLDLTAKELKLLQYFYSHPNEVLSRDRLLNDVWGMNYYGTTRTLDQHIAQLRKKVERDPAAPCVITTVHGVGYRYVSK